MGLLICELTVDEKLLLKHGLSSVPCNLMIDAKHSYEARVPDHVQSKAHYFLHQGPKWTLQVPDSWRERTNITLSRYVNLCDYLRAIRRFMPAPRTS